MPYQTKDGLDWDLKIEPHNGTFRLGLADVWRYRDLLMMFVRRDIVTVYKQTILGPIWFFLQPILTTVTFVFVFGNLAGISTDGVPQVLFYLSGITIWNYFSETLTNTSRTFIDNAAIFGKVYFPRLVLPISKVVSNLIKFVIQMALFLVLLVAFKVSGKPVSPNGYVLLTPVLLLLMAGLGLGFGIIISSLTTKYRDLTFLIAFGVQLLMFATPVIYPISTIPAHLKLYIWINPLTSVLEAFKFAFLGSGEMNFFWLAYSCCFTVVLLIGGAMVFNNVERSFVDTV